MKGPLLVPGFAAAGFDRIQPGAEPRRMRNPKPGSPVLSATRCRASRRNRVVAGPVWNRLTGNPNAAARWVLLTLCLWGLSACGTIPLPDGRPPLTELVLPLPGETLEAVRRTLGTPDVLDTDRDLIYEWTADRKLAFVLITPVGIPYGDVTFGRRFRLHVASDDTQRVAYVECSSDRVPHWKLRDAGCSDAGDPVLRTELQESFDLTRIPQLRKAPLWHAEGAGAPVLGTLSRSGSLLAMTDIEHTVWIIDLDDRQVVGRHIGEPPRFWAVPGVPQPHIDFAPDEQQLVISQGTTTALLSRQAGRFVPGATFTTPGMRLVRYGCCPPGLIGFGDAGVATLDPTGAASTLNASRGRLQFGRHGATVRHSATAAPVRVMALDSATLSLAVTALVGSDAMQHRVMDTRFDRARAASPASFAFSPDGRWLIRNACRHVEWWDTQQLATFRERGTDRRLSPSHVAVLPLAADHPRIGYTQLLQGDTCYGPIAFDPSASLMAVASRSAIHIWPIGSDGTPFPGGDRFHRRLDRHAGADVVSLALDADGLLTAATVDPRGRYAVSRWRVTVGPRRQAIQ